MNEQKTFMLVDRLGYGLITAFLAYCAIQEGDGWIVAFIMSALLWANRWNSYKDIKITPK